MKFRKEKFVRRDAKKEAKRKEHASAENARGTKRNKKSKHQHPDISVTRNNRPLNIFAKQSGNKNLDRTPPGQVPADHPSRKYPPHRELEGTIRITGKGVGYVSVEGVDDDIEIDPAFLGTALDMDRVRILLHPKRVSRRQGGEVTGVLLRSKTRWVGTLEKENGRFYLAPDDQRMYRDLLIPKDKLSGAQQGDKVFAELTAWTDHKKDPIGKVMRVIGEPGDHDVEMESIVLERGFDTTFSPAVLAAAENISTTIPAREAGLRRDFRDTYTFTIDPADAKDFDDALSYRPLPDGLHEIGIHIADVAHYVAPGSVLDQEALRRGTSIYLVDRTIPMLPERLSNGICSLVPDQDRLTFSAVFTLDNKGTIMKEWFGRTIIHSTKRYTYESAQEEIDKGKGKGSDILRTVNEIAKNIRAARMAAGAIAFEGDEVKFELDRDGTPIRVYRKTFHDTNRLIEEYMLLANKRVAALIATNDKRAGSVFVYRVHDEPNEDKIRDLRDFLEGIGYTLRIGKDGKVTGQDINRMLADVKGGAEEAMIQIATVRAMAKAVYATENIGHYGLGFEHYTHFTSPIRRYPDIMVHRLLAHYLLGKPVAAKSLESEERRARYASQMEVAAAEAERASIRAMQIKYWEKRIGAVWEGTISGVTEWGIYVEDKETKSEGMIPLRNIPDDFYFLEEKKYRIVGKDHGRIFRLGQAIRVSVIEVDPRKKSITLNPV